MGQQGQSRTARTVQTLVGVGACLALLSVPSDPRRGPGARPDPRVGLAPAPQLPLLVRASRPPAAPTAHHVAAQSQSDPVAETGTEPSPNPNPPRLSRTFEQLERSVAPTPTVAHGTPDADRSAPKPVDRLRPGLRDLTPPGTTLDFGRSATGRAPLALALSTGLDTGQPFGAERAHGDLTGNATPGADTGTAPASTGAATEGPTSGGTTGASSGATADTVAWADSGAGRLLFVWDANVAGDAAEREALIEFALAHGFDTLALEASGVGYGVPGAADTASAFAELARASGLQVHALFGNPWFTTAPGAGLPGQPTAHGEGLALASAIAGSGIFDGLVEDSQPYGVTYDVDGATVNHLFHDPATAAADYLAYLEQLVAALGDLPLVKTVPFWFDSAPELTALTLGLESTANPLAWYVGRTVDSMAVLSYRDTALGPNGFLALAEGELAFGDVSLVLETQDLGPDQDFLTFFEEGMPHLKQESLLAESVLALNDSFRGLGVHRYRTAAEIAPDTGAEFFGFFGDDGVQFDWGALADSYDSSTGFYYEQVTGLHLKEFRIAGDASEVGSNAAIQLSDGALIRGDAQPGPDSSVLIGWGAEVTGSTAPADATVEVLPLDRPDVELESKLVFKGGEHTLDGGVRGLEQLRLRKEAVVTIKGPATFVVERLDIGSECRLFVDLTAGPVALHVLDRMKLEWRAVISPSGLKAPGLTLELVGDQELKLGSESLLIGDLHAPDANVTLTYLSELAGAVTAGLLVVEAGAALHLDTALADD